MPLRYTSSVFARFAGLTNAHTVHSTGKQTADILILSYSIHFPYFTFHPIFLQFRHFSHHQLGNGFDINHIDSYSEYKHCDTMLANVIQRKVMTVSQQDITFTYIYYVIGVSNFFI